MRVESISNTEALLFILGVIAAAVLLFRAVPAGDTVPVTRRSTFTEAETTAYDQHLPKYLLAALTALVVAGGHFAVKSLPPVAEWLAGAGHGGHLVRDIANTHLMIVVGGTVTATALTWFVLPRVLRRPLATPRLAGASFWLTVIGATGFYVTNVAVGLAAGRMERAGQTWDSAEAALGPWKAVPVALTATIMGLGYWTFVATVLITAWASRRSGERGSDRHLAGFFVVGALGLFVGTVQGVIQVMPAQEAWLRAAAPAGEYIDPISHAHVNLVTGLLMLVAGALLYWTRDPERLEAERRGERAVFGVLLVGSVGFYLTFLLLGFSEGRLIVNEGLSFDEAVARLGWRHQLPLSVFGGLTFVAVVALLCTIVGRVRRGRVPAMSRPLVIGSAAALGVGVTQGVVQLTPAVKRFIEAAGQRGDAIANAHAQLNMLGGVVLALLAVVIDRSEIFLAAPVPRWVARATARLAIAGIGVAYLGSMVTAVLGSRVVLRGASPSADLVAGTIGPVLMVAGAASYTAGFGVFAWWAWRATSAYRADARRRLRRWVRAYDGPQPAWLPRIPRPALLVAEAAGASAGFPGLGWILSGRGSVGLPIALVGPSMAWAVLPAVMTGDNPFSLQRRGSALVVMWVLSTAVLSTAALAIDLQRRLGRASGAAP